MISFFRKKLKILKIKGNKSINFIYRKIKKQWNFKSNYMFEFIILIIVMMIMFYNANFILYISLNLRQADYKNEILKKSLKLFSLCDSRNYILDEIKPEIIPEIKKTEYSEYEILDDVVNDFEVMSVFNNVPSVNIIKDIQIYEKANVGNMQITNYSFKRKINYSEIISNANITLTKKSDKILLYNTHTSESYENSDKFVFDYTGTYRTTDANYNMLRIAKEFNKNLNEKGFISIQETTPHDYGAYTSAYKNSRITLENAISAYSGFGIVIDLHRDAIADLSFRPSVNIKGIDVAQVMLVVGAGNEEYANPYFEDDLKLALKLQYIGEQVYPGLFRGMIIRDSLYNQDVNKYSLLIEVGATGNTIEEAIMATRCVTNLLNIIYKD